MSGLFHDPAALIPRKQRPVTTEYNGGWLRPAAIPKYYMRPSSQNPTAAMNVPTDQG